MPMCGCGLVHTWCGLGRREAVNLSNRSRSCRRGRGERLGEVMAGPAPGDAEVATVSRGVTACSRTCGACDHGRIYICRNR